MRKILSFVMMTLFTSFVMADSYVKVTATPSDWEGDYLFVYEAENVAFNGGLATLDAAANTIAVEIADGVIAANETTNAAKFTLAAVEGGYSVKSASGKYIGVGSYSNGLKQADAVGSYVHNSLSIDADGNAIIAIYNETWNTTGGSMILNYNANKSDKRFRYYKGGSQKKIQLYKFTASSTPEPEPTTKTVYCKVAQDWWKADGAATGIYAYATGNVQNAAWPGVRMTAVEGETDLWKADIDTAKYDAIIFTRVNATGDIADWGAKTADLVVPADKDLYTITSTTAVWGDPGVTGTWSVYGEEQGEEEPATIKLHGNFNGSDWANTDAFSLADDKKTASLKLTLNKGNYEFGVRVGADNDWTANGVAFTRENKSAEVVKGSGNLTLAADTKGDYTFTWTYATNTLAIDFPEFVESLPVMEIAGAWEVKDEAWVKNAMTAAEDKKTASYEVELKAGDYEFKVIKDSKWLTKANEGNAYGLHREWTGVANVKDEATENLKLTADVDGKYTFVWTFENDSLGVVFPAKPVELQAVSEATTWDFSKITANTANALYNKEGIQLTDESTPNKNEEVVYANYSADFMTFAEGFDATTMAFKGEYPIRKNQYCQAGTLHFKTTVAGKIVVKFSDTGSSASATAVKRYLVVNGEQTEYWTSRENNGEAPYAAQLNVVSDEIAVPAGDVTITGSSAIVMYYVTFTPAAEPVVEPTLEDGFYLIGKIGGVEGWTIADLKAEQKFAPNLDNPVEFMLNVTLAEGDEIKVVNVLSDVITAWFPGDGSSNFVVTAAYAGEKTVYFRPDQQGGEGWHYGCIYIAPNQGTGISNTAVEGKAVKMIMDGQLLIIHNGKTYNVQGQQLK